MRGELSDFDAGVLVGLLVGGGSFGGDGRQPQITLRMHIRHQALFDWLVACFPTTRVYGPYGHGGRSYLQWMARGDALVHDVLPILQRCLGPALDAHASERLLAMVENYSDFIARARARR